MFVLTVLAGGAFIFIKPAFSFLGVFGLTSAFMELLSLHGRALSGALAIVAYWLILMFFVDRELLVRKYICDSTYFLGFIFTLLSLMCSFVDFGNPVQPAVEYSQSTLEFKKMVSFAGAALVTTMIAIILRVIHRHLYHNEDDNTAVSFEQYLQSVAKAFEETATCISARTGLIDFSMSKLSTSIDTVSEGFEAASSNLDRLTNETVENQEKIWKTYTGSLVEQTEAFVVELREANKVSVKFRGQTIDKLVPAMEGTASKLKEFSESLEQASPLNTFKKDVGGLGEGLTRLSGILEKEHAHRRRNIFQRAYYFLVGAP